METVGKILRKYREQKGLLLREVAAALSIDTALLSKYERNERIPSKEQLANFSKYYNADNDVLLVAWLSDRVASEVKGEPLAQKALKAAEKKVITINKKSKE